MSRVSRERKRVRRFEDSPHEFNRSYVKWTAFYRRQVSSFNGINPDRYEWDGHNIVRIPYKVLFHKGRKP